ncbi:probable inactive histone-lysine N-methyltransferase SUVR1 [Daucus carota subsp. sativus]
MDAMRRIGFKDAMTRKVLNELLKTYGRDNWAFIETDCYKVLLDAIIEALEQERLKMVDANENSTEFNHNLPATECPENIGQEIMELEVASIQNVSEQVKQDQENELGEPDEEEMNKTEEEMNQDVMNDGHNANVDFDLNELPPDDADNPSS